MKNCLTGFIEKNAYKFKVFTAFFILIYAGYALFMNQTFDPDNIAIISIYDPTKTNWLNSLWSFTCNGAPIVIVIILYQALLYSVGITYDHFQFVYQLSLIFLLAIGATILFFVFEKYFLEKDKKWLILMLLVGVVSPFYSEVFVFYGPAHGLGLFLAALGLLEFVKGRYIRAFIWVFLSVGAYPVYYEIFVIYWLAYICLQICNKSYDKISKQFIATFSIAGAAALLRVVVSKIYAVVTNTGEVKETVLGQTTIKDLFDSIVNIYRIYLEDLVHEYGVLPNYFLYFVVFFFLFWALVSDFGRYKEFLLLLLLIILIWAIPPSFCIVLKNPYAPARRYVGIFYALSATLLVCFKRILGSANKKIIHYIAYSMLLFYLCINYYSVQTAASDVLITNKMEAAQMRMMQNEIEKYELESGHEIKYVAVVHFPLGKNAYDAVNTNVDYVNDPLVHMVINQSWGDISFLNYITGENYSRGSITDEQIEEYFGDLEDDDFATFDPDKQLVFEGDTLYWAQY